MSLPEIDITLEHEDEMSPKPHRITIRLSDHDLRVIEAVGKQRGWSRSKVIRWFVRQVAKQLLRARLGEYTEATYVPVSVDLRDGVLTIRISRNLQFGKLVIERV